MLLSKFNTMKPISLIMMLALLPGGVACKQQPTGATDASSNVASVSTADLIPLPTTFSIQLPWSFSSYFSYKILDNTGNQIGSANWSEQICGGGKYTVVDNHNNSLYITPNCRTSFGSNAMAFDLTDEKGTTLGTMNETDLNGGYAFTVSNADGAIVAASNSGGLSQAGQTLTSPLNGQPVLSWIYTSKFWGVSKLDITLGHDAASLSNSDQVLLLAPTVIGMYYTHNGSPAQRLKKALSN